MVERELGRQIGVAVDDCPQQFGMLRNVPGEVGHPVEEQAPDAGGVRVLAHQHVLQVRISGCLVDRGVHVDVQPQQLPGILMPGLRRLTVRDLLAQGRITSNALEYVRENVFTNAAAPVAEGTLKPESNITFTKETANVKTIAHWIQASRQIMDDAPALESYLNSRMMYGLALVEENQMLNGDGTGDNLQGLNVVANDYETTLNATGDTGADVLAHAIYQVSLSEFEADGIILNPADWHRIALLKDANGNYILGGPQAFASKVLWGLPVVSTTAQTAGKFTVGAFGLASQVWDRMDATIEISNQDRDNFVKNMLTILCEERLALAHYRPAAIVTGDIAVSTGA